MKVNVAAKKKKKEKELEKYLEHVVSCKQDALLFLRPQASLARTLVARAYFPALLS